MAGKRAVGQGQLARCHGGQAHGLHHEGVGIARTEGVFAIEGAVGTAVPEQASEEPSVDDGRRIAARDLTQGLATAVEHIALTGLALVGGGAASGFHQCAAERTVRANHVVRGVQHRRMAVFGVCQAVQREIGEVERLIVAEVATTGALPAGVGRRDNERIGSGRHTTESTVAIRETDIAGAGVHLVRDAVVSTAGEVATGTGHAITTGLLVPEEGFAEQQRVLTVHDNAGQVRQGHVVRLEAAHRDERIHQGAHTHLPYLVGFVEKFTDRAGRMGHACNQWQRVKHRQQCGGGFAEVHGASWGRCVTKKTGVSTKRAVVVRASIINSKFRTAPEAQPGNARRLLN